MKKPKVDKSEEYLNGWKRALADYENLKKELGSEKEKDRNRIKESLVYDLLPVIDNFEQAVAHAPDLSVSPPAGGGVGGGGSTRFQSWFQGVLFIKKQFEDVMQGLGLEKITVSDVFDPNLHEAVGEAEEMKEVSSGWMLNGKVIRPAKIIIKK